MQSRLGRFQIVVLLVAIALLAAACASGESADDTTTTDTAATTSTTEGSPTEVTVETYYGGEDTVPFNPARVVVLDYAVLDTLDYLGLGDRVVGIPAGTPPPGYLSAYAELENVGNLFEFDMEAINALEPDLIIVGGRSYGMEEDMEAIAPAVDITFEWGSDTFLESLQMNTTAIGKIFGVEEQAQEALDQVDAAAADVAAQAADDGTGLVILTSGGEVSAYGPDPEGRFDLVYNVLGITPAAEQVAIDTHGDAVSFEFIADTNPDILIVLDRDSAIGAEGASAAEILDNELVNGTNASQNGKILYVDTAKWYLAFGGLNSITTMIEEVDSVVD